MPRRSPLGEAGSTTTWSECTRTSRPSSLSCKAGFTAHSKVELIQRLVVAVEQGRVSWPAPSAAEGPRAWEILTNEMKRFEYRLSPSGQISYAAPEGYHDDCVVALALANKYRHEYAPTGQMFPFTKLSGLWQLSSRCRHVFG